MENKSTIQSYVNNFRRHLYSNLKPDVGVKVNIYPISGSGGILEFIIGREIENIDNYMPSNDTISAALEKISQHAFGGNLSGFHFGGTNIIVEGDRVILIKGEDSKDEWSDASSFNDVKRVIPPTSGGPK